MLQCLQVVSCVTRIYSLLQAIGTFNLTHEEI